MSVKIEKGVPIESVQNTWMSKYYDTIMNMVENDSFFIEHGDLLDLSLAMQCGHHLGRRLHASLVYDDDMFENVIGVRVWRVGLGYDVFDMPRVVAEKTEKIAQPAGIFYYAVTNGDLIESPVPKEYKTYIPLTREKWESLTKAERAEEPDTALVHLMNGDTVVELAPGRVDRYLKRNPDAYKISELDYLMWRTGDHQANGSWRKGKPVAALPDVKPASIYIGCGGTSWGVDSSGAYREFALSELFPDTHTQVDYVTYLRSLVSVSEPSGL